MREYYKFMKTESGKKISGKITNNFAANKCYKIWTIKSHEIESYTENELTKFFCPVGNITYILYLKSRGLRPREEGVFFPPVALASAVMPVVGLHLLVQDIDFTFLKELVIRLL